MAGRNLVAERTVAAGCRADSGRIAIVNRHILGGDRLRCFGAVSIYNGQRCVDLCVRLPNFAAVLADFNVCNAETIGSGRSVGRHDKRDTRELIGGHVFCILRVPDKHSVIIVYVYIRKAECTIGNLLKSQRCILSDLHSDCAGGHLFAGRYGQCYGLRLRADRKRRRIQCGRICDAARARRRYCLSENRCPQMGNIGSGQLSVLIAVCRKRLKLCARALFQNRIPQCGNVVCCERAVAVEVSEHDQHKLRSGGKAGNVILRAFAGGLQGEIRPVASKIADAAGKVIRHSERIAVQLIFRDSLSCADRAHRYRRNGIRRNGSYLEAPVVSGVVALHFDTNRIAGNRDGLSGQLCSGVFSDLLAIRAIDIEVIEAVFHAGTGIKAHLQLRRAGDCVAPDVGAAVFIVVRAFELGNRLAEIRRIADCNRAAAGNISAVHAGSGNDSRTLFERRHKAGVADCSNLGRGGAPSDARVGCVGRVYAGDELERLQRLQCLSASVQGNAGHGLNNRHLAACADLAGGYFNNGAAVVHGLYKTCVRDGCD